jgi:hypothetical protein
MTKEELDMLEDLVQCGDGTGVVANQFTSQEQKLLEKLEKAGLVQIVWRITAAGKKELENS